MSSDGHPPKRARSKPLAPAEIKLEPDAQEALADQTVSDRDQTVSDRDQTSSDADQTHSEIDEAASETDRRLADEDQRASDQDQATADREQAKTPKDPSSGRAYDASRKQRADATVERGLCAATRAATVLTRSREAIQRDESARLRDLSALARDHSAEARDRGAERQAAALTQSGVAGEVIEALKASGTARRAQAAADRRRSASDRKRAAADRAQAALDRRRARVAIQGAYLDDLTGVYTRGLGLLTLEHEIDRARRSGEALVLALVDVDGLKQVNDSGGHAAGDALLRSVAAAIKSKLRSYDPIVRMGGDEFACAFTDASLELAIHRVEEIQQALEQDRPGASISVGLAQLGPTETLEGLLARGDAELYLAKGVRLPTADPFVSPSQGGLGQLSRSVPRSLGHESRGSRPGPLAGVAGSRAGGGHAGADAPHHFSSLREVSPKRVPTAALPSPAQLTRRSRRS